MLSALIGTTPRQGKKKPQASATTEDESNAISKQGKSGTASEDVFYKDKQEKFIEPPAVKQADAILQQSYVTGSMGKVFK
jgi:hypothetical protein